MTLVKIQDLPCDNDSDSDCLSEDSSDSSADWELQWKNLQKQKSTSTNAEPQKEIEFDRYF